MPLNTHLFKAWQIFMLFMLIYNVLPAQTPINRRAVVSRHNVVITKMDSLSSLSVGNGGFAFTVDATGLQTFPEVYEKGVPLGTLSQWCWDALKDTVGYNVNESLKEYDQNGRKVSYAVEWKAPERKKDVTRWFRENVHRVELGNLGLEITKSNGSPVEVKDIRNIRQVLNLWTGEITSKFTVEGIPVEVTTVCHQDMDIVSASVKSPLVKAGRLKIRLRFPYPTIDWTDVGDNWKNPEKHKTTIVSSGESQAMISHQLDSALYYTSLAWSGAGTLTQKQPHFFVIAPDKTSDTFAISCGFSPENKQTPVPAFADIDASSITGWKSFWSRGGAVDFAGSTDPRAKELERRIILSEYLTKIQCAGDFPPQETGLTYNSWYGKPHLEMHWWHGVHYPLWGRPDLLERSMTYYANIEDRAKGIATRQGYDGVRWPKMTDNKGNESPSSVGAMLIWQQPHFISFAELVYRDHPTKETLEKYKDLVFKTADFMASFATYDKAKDRYILGKGLIPAQERYKAEDTFNPTYELAYWNWALGVAQQWRLRTGMARNAKWEDVMAKLSALPEQKGLYLAAESATDSYTNPRYITDHPSVLATYGMLPGSPKLDKKVMRSTFDYIWKKWKWPETWGWDFPMTAMAATRLGMPEKAIDALFMNVKTNTYLANGHNYQDGRLRIYLPGNGGLLTAVALMCAGWDGCMVKNPGFPKNGKWKVKWEGLKPMP